MAAPRWFVPAACIAALLAFTPSAHAAGGGVGVSAEEAVPDEAATTAATILFHPYRAPSTQFPHANRDVEFLWSHTYVSAFNKYLNAGAAGQNDLDLFSKTIAEEYSNPFGYPMTDIQIVYDFLNFPSAFRSPTYNYSTTTADSIGFMVLGGTSVRPADRAHVDTYLYAPRFSHDPADDFYEPNTSYPSGCYDVTDYYYGCRNYGQWTSFFFSDSEDVSTGHSTSDVLHFNSQMVPGPVPSQVGDTNSTTRWSRQSGTQSGMWNHEFQHNFNSGTPSGNLTEIWSSAAEAIGGEAGGKPRFDVPYTFGLLESNYQAWREFTAYLAYNFRGTDLSFPGRTDDLLWRWARGSDHTFAGLASRLNNAECAECTAETWLNAYSTGYDRLQGIIHTWRVANFANNTTLAEGQYGYPAANGFVPWRDVGNWQDIDHLNPSDDVVALPQDVPLGKGTLARDTVLAGTRCRPGSSTDCTPVALRAYGSDYWLVKADASIRDANRTLRVRTTPLGRVAYPSCGFNGRLMVSIIAYSAPPESLNVLWRNPSYATSVVGPVALEVDSIRGTADLDLTNFGLTNNAAVVVLTLEEGSGAHLGLGGYTDGQPKLPYQLNIGLQAMPSITPIAVQARADSVDRSPAWSPSGTELAFIHNMSPTSTRIYRQNINGSGLAPLFVPSSPMVNYYCEWSPRGDWVVYDRGSESSAPFDIWAYNTVTAENRQITTHSEDDAYPSFSPNGQQISYWWYKNNTTWELHVVKIDGTGDYLVIAPGQGPWSPARWSADGASLLYSIAGTVYSVPAGGGSATAKPEYGTVRTFDSNLGTGRAMVEMTSSSLLCNAGTGTTQYKLGLRSLTLQNDDIRFLRSDQQIYTPRYSFDGTKAAFALLPLGGSDSDIYYGSLTYNHAPVFTAGVSDFYWDACIQLQRTLTATDADGETITYQGVNMPPGATIVTGNKFRWTPTADQVGDWYITFRAKDPSGGYANIVTKYTISNENDYCNNPPCPPNHPNCLPARAREVGGTDAPTVFALDQNEPNPFHGNTAIQFAVPRATRVQIEIFDLLGRRVRTLADGPFEVGFHSVQWDQRDQNGNLAHAGIYMYRMTAGSFRGQRKMLLTP